MAASEEYRCFVGGLAWTADSTTLDEAFRPFGEITEAKIINDRETGRSRGFGFVTFAEERAMREAIHAMNGTQLDGRNITVSQAQSRTGGGGGGGRSGAGGGNRGYDADRRGGRRGGYGASRYGSNDRGADAGSWRK